MPAVLQPSSDVAGVSGGGPTADLQAALERLHGAIGSLRGALEGAQQVSGGGGSPSGCGCSGQQGTTGAGALGAPSAPEPSAERPASRGSNGGGGRAEAASEFRGAAGQKLTHPLPGARMSSHYGHVSEIRNNRPHSGMDFAKPSGTPILAAASGRIARVGFESGGLGHFVEIDHGNGWATRYGHMVEKPNVSQGATVQAGSTIGKVGSTGNSTGPHLHFMVLRNGQHQNPDPFIKGEKTF